MLEIPMVALIPIVLMTKGVIRATGILDAKVKPEI